jgi:hypothetical protein
MHNKFNVIYGCKLFRMLRTSSSGFNGDQYIGFISQRSGSGDDPVPYVLGLLESGSFHQKEQKLR